MDNIIEKIATDLNIPESVVISALSSAGRLYKVIKIPKKSGGYRTAIQPTAELKMVHYWVITNFLNTLPTSNIATAFIKSSSILKNAEKHRYSLFSVRVDLKDFFPSIRSKDLISIALTIKNPPQWIAHPGFSEFIQRVCFNKERRLPIGYPTSPIIANAVMKSFDDRIELEIARNPQLFGESVLTRYADDFVFSTDLPGACNKFVELIGEVAAKHKSPSLQINTSKTRFMSRRGGSTLVTGLRINQCSDISVHSNYRDHVRLLMKLYSRDALNDEEHISLKGHLAFIESVDPKLFTKLSHNYFREIQRLRCSTPDL